jgi:hypothetical protein
MDNELTILQVQNMFDKAGIGSRETSIMRRAKLGQIRSGKKGNGDRIFYRDDIERFIKQQLSEIEPPSDGIP